MSKHSRRASRAIPYRRIESVIKAIAVAMVLLVLVGIAVIAYVAKSIDTEAPRSAVEYQMRRAEQMVDADPSNLEAWLALGAAQSDAGSYSAAISSLKKVLDAEPENEDAWMELGQVYRRKGDEAAAIEAYENALKWAQKALADRRAELEAKDITEELVMPEAGARACIALAGLYAEAGDYDKARAAAQTLISDNPMDAAALIALAEVEEAAGNTDAAIEAYNKALQFLPNDPDITAALERLGAE